MDARLQCFYGDNPRGMQNNGKAVQARIEAGGFDQHAAQIWYENPKFKDWVLEI